MRNCISGLSWLVFGLLWGGFALGAQEATSGSVPSPSLTHGPFVGAVGAYEARVWARAEAGARFRIRWAPVGNPNADPGRTAVLEALPARDGCMTWVLTGLQSATRYHYEIVSESGQPPAVSWSGHFQTVGRFPGTNGPIVYRETASVFFGSCANDKVNPIQPIWQLLGDGSAADALVLLGDTPYIDTTMLKRQRARYAEFFGMPALRAPFANLPLYATWDDHDFGQNDTDGRLPGKANSRRAFLEYHALESYGQNDQGIYTRFRRGPMEVFLLDTRWFAGTEAAFEGSEERTLLGNMQWDWLKAQLSASTAPVKVLASGMIWNGAVRPNKPDHWAKYPYDRDRLFRFIGQQGIPGVVLVGGDIHRARIVRHETRDRAGYDLYEFISSPMATLPMASAKQPHPGLLFDVGSSGVLLELSVGVPTDSLPGEDGQPPVTKGVALEAAEDGPPLGAYLQARYLSPPKGEEKGTHVHTVFRLELATLAKENRVGEQGGDTGVPSKED